MPVAENVNFFRDTQINLKYTLQGPAGGPVVVFIPGLGSQLVQLTYNTLVGPLINRGFRVLRIENRDAGHSTILTGYESPSIAKGITANLMNPSTDKGSPIFFDTAKPVSKQQNPALFSRGQDPRKSKTSTESIGDDGNLPLGDDYNVYPGFQPRDIVYETILQRRQGLLATIAAKRSQTSSPTSTSALATKPQDGDDKNYSGLPEVLSEDDDENGDQNDQNGPDGVKSGQNVAKIPSFSTHENAGRSPSTVTRILNSMKPVHDLYDGLTTSHRAPIAALYEQFFYGKETNRLSRSYESLYCVSEMAVDAILLINKLEISDFHILGSSMGGFIATWVAALVPNRILSLTMVMSGTGTTANNPDLFYLVKNLLRPRPPPPPFPKVKERDLETVTGLRLQTDAAPTTTTTTPKKASKPTEKDLKKLAAQALKQYKVDLKEFNKNRKVFNNYVDFLVETNAIVGTPSVHPVTGVPKTYNNGRAVRDHVARWCSRAPFARGHQNQSGAILASPCRDALLFFLAQHFPIFVAHGSADELVPVGSAHHSYDLIKGAMQHVAPLVGGGEAGGQNNQNVQNVQNGWKNDQNENNLDKIDSKLDTISTSTTTTTTTKIITSTSSPSALLIDPETEGTATQKVPNSPSTVFVSANSASPDSPTATLDPPSESSAPNTPITPSSTIVVPQFTSPTCTPLRSQTYSLDNDRADVTRIAGCNRNTKIWLQHRKLIIKEAKHEVVDSFTKYFVPQLILHLEQAQTGESKSLDEIYLEEFVGGGGIDQEPPEFQPAPQYEDEDLLYGLSDDELEYYDPKAPPPPPPAGYALVLKKNQYVVVESEKIKGGQEVQISTPKISTEHPEYVLSPTLPPQKTDLESIDDDGVPILEGDDEAQNGPNVSDDAQNTTTTTTTTTTRTMTPVTTTPVGAEDPNLETTQSFSVIAQPSNQEEYKEEKMASQEKAKHLEKETKEREKKDAEAKEREKIEAKEKQKREEKERKERGKKEEKEKEKREKEKEHDDKNETKKGLFGRLKVRLLGNKAKNHDGDDHHDEVQKNGNGGTDKASGHSTPAGTQNNAHPSERQSNPSDALSQRSHQRSQSQLSVEDVEAVEQPQYDQ